MQTILKDSFVKRCVLYLLFLVMIGIIFSRAFLSIHDISFRLSWLSNLIP